MKIGLIGMNHKTAPVEIRERISLGCDIPGQRPLIKDLLHIDGVKEGVYFSTCNRVEALYASDDADPAYSGVLKFFTERFQVEEKELLKFLYVLWDDDAVRHLFRVASSLDSMVIGEPQILGQIKESYREASEHKAAGVILNRLLHRAFFVAKRVRNETHIANAAVSISYAAVELAKKIFDDLSSKKALLIGAGEMAELAARHLLNNGVREITVANRTLERAMEVAKSLGGRPALLDELEDHLISADIVISSTGAPGYVVKAETLKKNRKKRRNRPLFLIDIAVPRDIEPDVDKLQNTYLYNIDELQGIVEVNLDDRRKEAVRAERLIEEETIKFRGWLEGLSVVPTIIGLQEKSEEIRQAELKKSFSSLKDLSPEQAQAIDLLTKSIVKKMLHDPIQFLKQTRTHQEGKAQDLDYTRRIFNLNHGS